MAVFFTSDTHFGHGGALGLFRRPFASVKDMDEALIRRWNETVTAEDEVWHLGDFAVRRSPDCMMNILERLKGRKHLIAGNNDPPAMRELRAWESVGDYAELTVEGLRLVLCHYPFRSWNGMGRGVVNLHGHSHGKLAPMRRQIDVGVDVWDFRPLALAQLADHLTRRRRSAVS